MRWLKNVGTGVVFRWTEALAAKKELAECTKEGMILEEESQDPADDQAKEVVVAVPEKAPKITVAKKPAPEAVVVADPAPVRQNKTVMSAEARQARVKAMQAEFEGLTATAVRRKVERAGGTWAGGLGSRWQGISWLIEHRLEQEENR